MANFTSKKGSFTYEHLRECRHATEGDKEKGTNNFEMEVVGIDKDPLRRIIREAIRIKDDSTEEQKRITIRVNEIEKEITCRLRLLNSKREFHLPKMGSSQLII